MAITITITWKKAFKFGFGLLVAFVLLGVVPVGYGAHLVKERAAAAERAARSPRPIRMRRGQNRPVPVAMPTLDTPIRSPLVQGRKWSGPDSMWKYTWFQQLG